MFLREIFYRGNQKIIKDIFIDELTIISIILFNGVVTFLKTLFFPTGLFSIEIIIFLCDLYAIFLIGHRICMGVFERVYNSYKKIQKMQIH